MLSMLILQFLVVCYLHVSRINVWKCVWELKGDSPLYAGGSAFHERENKMVLFVVGSENNKTNIVEHFGFIFWKHVYVNKYQLDGQLASRKCMNITST